MEAPQMTTVSCIYHRENIKHMRILPTANVTVKYIMINVILLYIILFKFIICAFAKSLKFIKA